MTFKAKAYKLTKEVKKSEKRQELQALIHDLSYGKADPSDSADRSHLGYLARQKGMQFLGFLFIDKERDALLQNHPFPIPTITNDERLLLAGAHENLLRLNQKCIEVIGEQDIDFGNVLSPFKEERYIPSDHRLGIKLFSDADIRIVQQAFSLHPAIGVVKDALALLRLLSPRLQKGAAKGMMRSYGDHASRKYTKPLAVCHKSNRPT